MEMRDNERLLGSINRRQRIDGLSTRGWEEKISDVLVEECLEGMQI